MIPPHRLVLIMVTMLAVAAWLNASQEKRGACTSGSCSPLAITLGSVAAEMKPSSR